MFGQPPAETTIGMMAAWHGKPIRLGARTNLALALLLASGFLTGWLAFAYATAPARWSLVVHATSGFGILVLLPWKSMVARRGLGRPRPRRSASVLLGTLVILSLAAGLGHSTGLVLAWGPLTDMDVHVGAAIAAVPFVIWHVVARRIRLRPADMSRRSFLRGGVAMATAAASYGASEIVVRAAHLPGGKRRFTGSFEVGSYRPHLLPISSWMFDSVPQVDTETWRLHAGSRSWTYEELFSFDDRVTATLDCTGGFFSTQEWAGARLARLVGQTRGGTSIRVVSRTGYDRRYPVGDAGSLLLATRIGGRPLDSGHGFPARLVAADRRGFWWVKWVDAIEIDDMPDWWQSPFPLQ